MQHIIISFSRKDKTDDWKLKMLLRSIEKFLGSVSITIVGNSVEHFLNISKINYISNPSKTTGNFYERHSKNINLIIHKYQNGLVVLNGTVFTKSLKKSNFSQIPVFNDTRVSIDEKIKKVCNYTINELKQKKMYKYLTYPFTFFPLHKFTLEKMRKKFPEFFSEIIVFPIVYANFASNYMRTEFREEAFIIKPVNCFNDMLNEYKNIRSFYLMNDDIDIMIKLKIEKLLPHKSSLEL